MLQESFVITMLKCTVWKCLFILRLDKDYFYSDNTFYLKRSNWVLDDDQGYFI